MYDQHYGLTGRPFQLTPDPRFWFDTATHRKAMAYLGYGLSQGEGFIVISGDVGAGKTTLVGHLVDTIDADRLNVIRIVSTQIAADDLLRTVCAGLDVDASGLSKATMLTAIERGLHAVARGGRRTLLIVDEAQALPVDSLEELRMLSNFQAGGHALLQIFLLGQPEFRDKLADTALEQLRQRVIAMHHLGPMEADELEPYLVHRLTVVGWSGRPLFKPDAVAAIYVWSGGIPRRVNQLVSRVLLHGAIEGLDSFAAADVATVIHDLEGDGMRGSALPRTQPAVQEARPLTMAVAPESMPIAPEVPAEEPAVVEWPFVGAATAAEPEAEWRPIAVEAPVEEEAVDDPVLESNDTAVEELQPAAPETRPATISAPVSLFDRFSLRGRKPMLAPVDPEPPVEAACEDARPAPAEETAAAVIDLDVARRLADIDKRLEDQDEALRRVLTLLVDWVEGGGARSEASGFRDKVG